MSCQEECADADWHFAGKRMGENSLKGIAAHGLQGQVKGLVGVAVNDYQLSLNLLIKSRTH
jgi:hypothetical protein